MTTKKLQSASGRNGSYSWLRQLSLRSASWWSVSCSQNSKL